MDLFGRKARASLAVTEAQLEIVLAWLAEAQDRARQLESQAIIKQGAIDRLGAEVIQLKSVIDARPQLRMRAYPLYKSEEEEEIEYALRNGDIDQREASDLLKQIGFDNSVVELPERPERPLIY